LLHLIIYIYETDAEEIAFVLCQSIGLSTGTASSDSIQLYHGNAKLLSESLEIVQRIAARSLRKEKERADQQDGVEQVHLDTEVPRQSNLG